jgi:chromosome segregation ATPase
LKKEAPLHHLDLTPTTVEGTFSLPKGVVFSGQVVQLKTTLDDLCYSTYHILQRHLPPLEQRAEEVQREIWSLSEQLNELQPQREPLEVAEVQRTKELQVVAQYKKDRLVQMAEEKERHKKRVLVRLEQERLAAQRESSQRETFLKTDQANAEKRAQAHWQEVNTACRFIVHSFRSADTRRKYVVSRSFWKSRNKKPCKMFRPSSP